MKQRRLLRLSPTILMLSQLSTLNRHHRLVWENTGTPGWRITVLAVYSWALHSCGSPDVSATAKPIWATCVGCVAIPQLSVQLFKWQN